MPSSRISRWLKAGGFGLAVLICRTLPVLAADVTFFGYSDLHYLETDTAGRSMVGVINALPGTAYPTSMGGTVDTPRGVVMPGDLINDGAVAAKYPTQWANYIADFGVNGEGRCDFPVFEGLGNHDVNTDLYVFNRIKDRTVIRQSLGWITNVSSNGFHYSWDWDGVHFVVINIFGGNIWYGEADTYGDGHNPKYARDFLEADLREHVGNTGRPVVVVQHFRPVDENWWTYAAADKFHKVIQDYNVIALVVGHQGGGVNNTWRGINWMSCNGALNIFRITSDNEFSVVNRSATAWGTPFTKTIYTSYATSGLAAAINNGDWASNITTNSATLSGKVLYEAAPGTSVTIYWGTTDGGTTIANWQNSTNVGVCATGTVVTADVTGLQPWTTYYYRCRASNSAGSVWAAASIPFATAGLLPSGWRTGFLGYVQRYGDGAREVAGTFTVRGSGRDIGEGSIDNFEYASLPLTGNGSITARVVSMSGSNRDPKVGVMLRERRADNARSAAVLINSSTAGKLYTRSSTGGGCTISSSATLTLPYWVRVVRSGNVFTGYVSSDGSAWTQVGSATTIAMATTAYVGLGVTAGNRDGSGNHTATFDSLTITGDTTYTYAHWRTEQFSETDAANDAVSGPSADPDKDGLPNQQEFYADTRPKDGSSLLEITGVNPEAGGLRVNWKGGQQVMQVLEVRDRMNDAGGWTAVYTNLPPMKDTATILDLSGAGDSRFYRIRAQR